MFDFEQKRHLNQLFKSWVIPTVIFLFTIVVSIGAYDRYMIARDMAERRMEVEKELQAVERRRGELESEVQYLTNERGIEAEMRRQFDVTRSGEQVVIIIDDNPVSTTSDDELAPATVRPWYRFW
jgi:cell division protein FtsB